VRGAARMPRRPLPHSRPPGARHVARARRDRQVPDALASGGTYSLAFAVAGAGGRLRRLAFVARALPLRRRIAIAGHEQAGQSDQENEPSHGKPAASSRPDRTLPPASHARPSIAESMAYALYYA